MKNASRPRSLSLTIMVLLVFSGVSLFAQSRRKAPEKVPFGQQLWYGGSLGAGFSSSNLGGGLQGNIFFLGVSPMVGYKFNNWFSAGPRAEIQWYSGRFREFGSGPVYRYNVVNLGIGMFARAKILQQFFLHGEYGIIQYTYPVDIDYQNNRINTDKETIDQLLMGAGISFGGVFASEFSILYNFLAPDDTIDLPIVFRYGFTYRF